MDNTKHIWEGWTVQDFIDELELTFLYVVDRLKTREQLKEWCMSEQPYYKRHIPEVYNHFLSKSNI